MLLVYFSSYKSLTNYFPKDYPKFDVRSSLFVIIGIANFIQIIIEWPSAKFSK
jgi:hypothetical protein